MVMVVRAFDLKNKWPHSYRSNVSSVGSAGVVNIPASLMTAFLMKRHLQGSHFSNNLDERITISLLTFVFQILFLQLQYRAIIRWLQDAQRECYRCTVMWITCVKVKKTREMHAKLTETRKILSHACYYFWGPTVRFYPYKVQLQYYQQRRYMLSVEVQAEDFSGRLTANSRQWALIVLIKSWPIYLWLSRDSSRERLALSSTYMYN